MYNLQLLIDKLKTEFPLYSVDFAKAIELDLGKPGDPTSIRVAYHSVEPAGVTGDVTTENPFETYAEDFEQLVILNYVCDVANLPVVFNALKVSISGWCPYPTEALYSGHSYAGGGTRGISSGRYWWQDKWRISSPRDV